MDTFKDCNLNPSSPNFIAKKIGDQKVYLDLDKDKEHSQKIVVDGMYPVQQRGLIRVEISEDLNRSVNSLLISI